MLEKLKKIADQAKEKAGPMAQQAKERPPMARRPRRRPDRWPNRPRSGPPSWQARPPPPCPRGRQGGRQPRQGHQGPLHRADRQGSGRRPPHGAEGRRQGSRRHRRPAGTGTVAPPVTPVADLGEPSAVVIEPSSPVVIPPAPVDAPPPAPAPPSKPIPVSTRRPRRGQPRGQAADLMPSQVTVRYWAGARRAAGLASEKCCPPARSPSCWPSCGLALAWLRWSRPVRCWWTRSGPATTTCRCPPGAVVDILPPFAGG